MLWFFAGRQVTPMRAPSLARVHATPSGGSSNSRPDLSEAGERALGPAKATFSKRMRKGELIQECEKRGLSTVGTKAVLLGRLQDCDETVYMAKQAGGVKPLQPVDKEVEVQKEAESGSKDENPKPSAMETEKAAVAKKSQEEALLGELSAVLTAEEELMAQSMALEQEDDMTPALKKAEIALQQVVALKAEDDARSEAALQKAAERLTEKTMASLQRSADDAAEPKVPRDMVIAGRRITVSVRPMARNATFPGLALLGAASHVTSVFGSFWKSVRNTLAPPDQEKMDAGAMVLAFALVASLML